MYDTQQEEILAGLLAFLSIPSVSALPQHAADIQRAASFIFDALQQAGLPQVEIVEGQGHPLVYAESLRQPGKPTLLLYGHYDVQPADPLHEWRSPPFQPIVQDDNVYARGASDDKGQVWILIQALRQLVQEDGGLPLNIRVLIEGEEESGGEHVTHFVQTQREKLACDAVLICDTEMFAPGMPTLCTGLRGIVYAEVHVTGAAQDLHSGMYGGAAPNAIQAAAEVVCALKEANGRIRDPRLSKGVVPPSAEEQAAWERLPFDEGAFLRDEIGAASLVGDPAYGVLERLWAQPSIEVHGIRGGFVEEGAKTVIPARAVIKLSMRLAPDQDPAEMAAALGSVVQCVCPQGAQVEFKLLHAAPSARVDPSLPIVQAAAASLRQVMQAEPAYIRGGGSIPIVSLFQKELGAPSVLMGFGLPDDRIHSPNEKFHLPNLWTGIACVKAFLRQAAAL